MTRGRRRADHRRPACAYRHRGRRRAELGSKPRRPDYWWLTRRAHRVFGVEMAPSMTAEPSPHDRKVRRALAWSTEVWRPSQPKGPGWRQVTPRCGSRNYPLRVFFAALHVLHEKRLVVPCSRSCENPRIAFVSSNWDATSFDKIKIWWSRHV